MMHAVPSGYDHMVDDKKKWDTGYKVLIGPKSSFPNVIRAGMIGMVLRDHMPRVYR